MHTLDHQWPLTNGDPWRRDVINAWRVVAARLRRGWAWATVLWAASSCAAPGTIAPDTGTAAAQLDTLYEAYFEQRLQGSPSSATFIGDHRFDDRLENSASPAYEAALKREQQHFLAQAQAINTATLTRAQRLSYDIFVGDRQLTLERLSFPDRLLPIDQMGSMASTFALLGSGHSAQPFKTVEDYRAFLARAEDFSLWVDSAIDAMREGVDTGVVNPQVIMLKVVKQLRDIARDPLEQSIFWQPIAALPTNIAVSQRQQLTESYRQAIVTTIVPAYRRLADFIERDYLPHTRTSVGMGALPNGQAWYRYQIRKQTTTELSADEIHALGQAEMERIRGEINTVLQALHFQGSVQTFYRHVQNDARFFCARSRSTARRLSQPQTTHPCRAAAPVQDHAPRRLRNPPRRVLSRRQRRGWFLSITFG